MCVSVCILVSFTVFYCTSCIAFFLSFTYTVYLSVCLSVPCLCLWAMLPDLNKMIICCGKISKKWTFLLQQIAGSYLLVHALLSKLTRLCFAEDRAT